MSAATDCPRWQKCSANICPADPTWHSRTHIRGERVCALIREVAKAPSEMPAKSILVWYVSTELAAQVSEVIPEMLRRYAPLKKGFRRSSEMGSRLTRTIGAKR